MQYNELNGSIPKIFGLLRNIEKINLVENNLNGDIPKTIFNITSLVEISFENSSFSGNLPVDICENLPKLDG